MRIRKKKAACLSNVVHTFLGCPDKLTTSGLLFAPMCARHFLDSETRWNRLEVASDNVLCEMYGQTFSKNEIPA